MAEIKTPAYYWGMDLAVSLWERVATIGNAKGRKFAGTHGDGVLDQLGNATNTDWPTENEGGFGCRGGGTWLWYGLWTKLYYCVAARSFTSRGMAQGQLLMDVELLFQHKN